MTTIQSTTEIISPDWSRARSIMDGIKTAMRLSLAGQVLMGHELLTLKSALGFVGRGGDRSKPQTAVLPSMNRTWDDWCRSELGISPDTADRMIETYEAAKSRIAKLGGDQHLALLLETPPAKLTDEDRNVLGTMVDKLVWGETQSSLLEEFRIVKRTQNLEGGDTSKHKQKIDPNAAAQQLAFAFFSPIPSTLAKLDKTIGNLRHHSDYQGFLHTLPLTSSTPEQISLSSLESTLQTALEGDLVKALDDIRAAKAARMMANR
jgi:hypothetical protein